MLDEKEVKRLSEKHNLSYKHFGSTVLIETGLDEWQINAMCVGEHSEREDVVVYELRHKNTSGNRSGKAHFHRQRIVPKLEYAFETIAEHQPYINETEGIANMFDKLNK